ncbi:UNVERIFIED_CONTAM: hypothetical protein RMT77_014866 [Armadillidium vulgare]
MDIKIKIDIKDELTVEEPHFSHHLNQVSDLEEIQERTYYPNIRIKNDIEVKEEPFDFEDKNTSNVPQNFETVTGLDENESSSKLDSKIRPFVPDSFENDEELFRKIFLKPEMEELEIEFVKNEEQDYSDVIKSENQMMVDKKLSNQHKKKFMNLKNVSSLLNKVRGKCSSEVHFESEEEEFFAKLVTSEFPQVLLKRRSYEELKTLISDAAEGENNSKNSRPQRAVRLRQRINKSFSCKYCDFSFKSKDELKTHLKTHSKIFKCDSCPLESKFEFNMKRHMLNHNNFKLFKCYECSYGCNNKDALISHMIVHEDKKFTCHLCNGKYKTKRSLKLHMAIHENLKLFKCSQCSYRCNHKNNLRRHEASHGNVKLFKCTECSYETNYKTHLKRHNVNHENLKLFKCSQCPYESNYKVNLDKHTLNHKNIKLFSCSECPYGSNSKGNLQQHILYKHPYLLCKC